MIEHTNIVHITNLEEAVSALYQKVFGFKLYITPADTPTSAPAPAPITYETENDLDILRAQRDAWEETAAARSHRIEDKNATIARLKDKLAVTAEVMQDNIDLKAEAERLHTLWHEAQHALDLLRDHHKAAQEEINVYEACVKRNAEAMRRSRIAWAEHHGDNRTLAAEREDYENLWIEACDQLVKERNA